MEMQSKTSSIIYENAEKDKYEIEMADNPNTYESFQPQSVRQNEDIYEDVKKDEIRLSETVMSEDPDSMNAYETQSDAIYENPSADDDEEVTKAEISNPVSTFKPMAKENPYVFDVSTKITNNTTK